MRDILGVYDAGDRTSKAMNGTFCGIRNAAQKDEFARLVFGGMSKAEAYRQAFGKPELGAEAARKAGNRLSHDGYILERLKELGAQVDCRAVMDRQARMVWLSAQVLAVEPGAEPPAVANAIRCIAELNKMDGAYEPTKVETREVGACTFEAVMAAVTDLPD